MKFTNEEHYHNFIDLIEYWSAEHFESCTGSQFYAVVYLLAVPDLFASISDIYKCPIPDPLMLMPQDILKGHNYFDFKLMDTPAEYNNIIKQFNGYKDGEQRKTVNRIKLGLWSIFTQEEDPFVVGMEIVRIIEDYNYAKNYAMANRYGQFQSFTPS